MSFLATTASITPYIGLFGTVWGIMAAFQGIGATGSTNLGVVAPGIAEALIATAAGLFAAIPAVYFYNHLTGAREAARLGDGRLLARVPQHLRAELHLGTRRRWPKSQSLETAAGGRVAGVGAGSRAQLAEINVVPLVDVMLVLLIIFMVAAPMMQRGHRRQRCRWRAGAPRSARALFVTVPLSYRKARIVYIDDDPIRVDILDERVRQAMLNKTGKEVFLRGDGGVQLQDLLDVMDRAEGCRCREGRHRAQNCRVER